MSQSNENERSYAQIVQEAEKAVAAVKDPELRRVAFEKILSVLLTPVSDQFSAPNKTSRRSQLKQPTNLTRKHRKTKTSGPKQYVDELIASGFFDKPKTIGEVRAELGNRGHHIPITSLSGPMQKLCQAHRLRRDKNSTTGKKKGVYTYIKK